MKIYYRKLGYHLAGAATVKTEIYPPATVQLDEITLEPNGTLTLNVSFAWNGGSGPALDTPDAMPGYAVHDALYRLIQEGRLDEAWRDQADLEMWKIHKENGVWSWRRAWQYAAVHWFGLEAARTRDAVYEAGR